MDAKRAQTHLNTQALCLWSGALNKLFALPPGTSFDAGCMRLCEIGEVQGDGSRALISAGGLPQGHLHTAHLQGADASESTILPQLERLPVIELLLTDEAKFLPLPRVAHALADFLAHAYPAASPPIPRIKMKTAQDLAVMAHALRSSSMLAKVAAFAEAKLAVREIGPHCALEWLQTSRRVGCVHTLYIRVTF